MNASDFIKPSKEEWAQKAAIDLKTEDLNELLNWQPFEGISATAYYDATDIPQDAMISFFAQTERPETQLLEDVRITDELSKNNQQALHALQMGATGIKLHADVPVNGIDTLFKGILPAHCMIGFTGEKADEWSDAFLKKYSDTSITGFVIDGKKLQTGLPTFRSIGLSVSTDFDIIPVLVSYLQGLEKFHHIYGEKFLAQLNVSVSINQKFYQSVALIRAIRWLTYLFAKAGDISTNVSDLHLDVNIQTSGEYKKDMLINTSAGVAAWIGGANSVGFKLDSPKGAEFNQRIARNTGNLMRDESHLMSPSDPSSGAYFIDFLTNAIAEKAWNAYINLS